jgi:hypothetical protein
MIFAAAHALLSHSGKDVIVPAPPDPVVIGTIGTLGPWRTALRTLVRQVHVIIQTVTRLNNALACLHTSLDLGRRPIVPTSSFLDVCRINPGTAQIQSRTP